MKVFITRTKSVSVATYAEASRVVRAHIETHDLGAGCGSGPAFTGGKVVSELGGEIARVSYNGRVWDVNGKEVI